MAQKQNNQKSTLSVLTAASLRDILNQVNAINRNEDENSILKEDIVQILNIHDTYFLLYFR